MFENLLYFLIRKYKKYSEYVIKAGTAKILRLFLISITWSTMTVLMTSASYTEYDTKKNSAVQCDLQLIETTATQAIGSTTAQKNTTITTTAGTTTTKNTSAVHTANSSSEYLLSTTTYTTVYVEDVNYEEDGSINKEDSCTYQEDAYVEQEIQNYAEEITSNEDSFQEESYFYEDTTYSEEESVGQYGYAINTSEYTVLAQVIEHEGGNCPVYVKEHIGICLLNRVFAPGFKNSILECKQQKGQYFYGYYAYTEESALIAQYLIEAYNSGAESWATFCEERGMTWDTKYQRNNYCVPGTTYVCDDYDCTSGGFWFHMYYSK